jgi:hypothetical protein
MSFQSTKALGCLHHASSPQRRAMTTQEASSIFDVVDEPIPGFVCVTEVLPMSRIFPSQIASVGKPAY